MKSFQTNKVHIDIEKQMKTNCVESIEQISNDTQVSIVYTTIASTAIFDNR